MRGKEIGKLKYILNQNEMIIGKRDGNTNGSEGRLKKKNEREEKGITL